MDGSAAVDPDTCDSASCFVLGVTIAGVAAFLYASGLCVQRAALTGAPHSRAAFFVCVRACRSALVVVAVEEAGETGGAAVPGCEGACCLRCAPRIPAGCWRSAAVRYNALRKPTAAGRWSTANWVIGLLIYAIGGLFLGTVVRMPRGLDGCALPCGPR